MVLANNFVRAADNQADVSREFPSLDNRPYRVGFGQRLIEQIKIIAEAFRIGRLL